jgi:hypothetical protein
MSTWKAPVVTAAVILLSVRSVTAQQTRTSETTLTAQDRAELEQLTARYALALGMCDADAWPELFAAPDGYFVSGSRGKVQGHRKLGEMVRSYNCVYNNGVPPPHAPAVLVPYKLVIERSPEGARGTAYYNGGHYEDVYVKTGAGWRFKSRTVVTNREQAANLTAADFEAIQELAAANGGPYVDVYEQAPGGSLFKSSGVVIEPSPVGATGKAYLKDGGRYEDVYVKTPGGWRFQSRRYVAAERASPVGTGAAGQPIALTALDYVEIQQLVAKYAKAIDTCSNNGYDYADLYTPDGVFAPSRNGQIGTKSQGREQLAEASGGGVRGCRNVGWIQQGVRHVYANHIITPAADGATGSVDMLMIGLGGDPNKIQYEGHYEDVYVKTPQGWRFKSRTHVNPVTVGPGTTPR